MTQIHSVSEKGKKIIIRNSADKDQDGQITVVTETLATERGCRSNNTVASAMEQLNTVLSQKWLLDARDLKVIKSVRDELTPLQDLLDEVEGLEDQQLYQVWVHQIEGVFQLVYETFASRGVKQGNGFRSLIAPLYNVPLSRLDQKILKIRKQISEICRRYHTYEIGEFRGRETWRRVFVPKLISPDIYTSVSAVSSTKDITEWLRVEMELMKYFIEHAQIREDSDERHKVWFRQMEEIYPDLEAKAVFAQGIIEERGNLFNPLSWIRFENRVKKIQKQIYYMSNRKIAYDISSSIMQQAASTVIPQPPPPDILPGDDEEHTLRESNPRRPQWWSLFCLTWRSLIISCSRYSLSELERTFFSECWFCFIPCSTPILLYLIICRSILSTIGNTSDLRHSVERELQLMDALLKDIRTMMELDARLNIWAEEVQAVVEEARHVLEQGAGPAILLHKRYRFAKKLSWIMNRIDQVHEWKMTYDITIKGRKGSGAVIQEREPYPSGFLSSKIQSIKREMNLMQALMEDVKMMDRVDAKVQVWVEEISGIALEVKNLIDLYCKENKLVIAFIDAFNVSDLKWIAHVNRLKKKIQRLHNRRLDYGIEHIAGTPPYFVEEIKARLLMNCQDLCIFPILGVKDNDKAKLQQLLNDDYTIICHFDVRVYIRMPQELNVIAILKEMANQVIEQLQPAEHNNDQGSIVEDQEGMSWSVPKLQDALHKDKWSRHEVIAQALKELLYPIRYLVVFHDIQIIRGIWSDLRQAFPNASSGSRVVLFTAHEAVENTSELLSLYHNSELNDTADPRNEEIDEISNFPLQAPIRVRDSSRERAMSKWEKVLERLNRKTPHLEAADVIYGKVPGYLRQCLYCFLLFPKDFKIPARRLIALWVAEGIAKQKRGEEESAEDIAESYLNELIDQNVVQATKTKLNGKVKVCQLRDGTRKWLEKVVEANFFKDSAGRICRLVDHLHEDDVTHRQIHGNDHPISSNSFRRLYGNVLSFLSFDTQEGSKPGENIGCFLSKCISNRCFRSLRVLDLEKVFRPQLPRELSALSCLRYLGLRWTYLEELPSSISKMLNLQLLDLKHTYISALPESIWKMHYLRHLYMSETYRSKFPSVPKRIALSELQTLWGAFIDEDSPVLEGLNTLKEVKKLGLSCRAMTSQQLMNSQLEAVGDWILELKQLESLRLKSFDEHGNPSTLYLKPLSSLTSLSTIYLLGKLKYPSVISGFPTNLIDLTLSASELQDDPMPALENLRKLIILRFYSKSSTCKSMHCSSGGFPELRFLQLWLLEQLETLKIVKGAMPNLESLEIRSCTRLEMLPSQLQHMPALKRLKLSPQEFQNKIKENQRQLWSNLEHLVEDPFE
ncbi:putative disease resistance protein At1g59780 [Nicotiana tabacum]|uniref:Disease resistance protein At1g59780 n=4 Tax=Nicotiana tabacum TaxID=4097 RepID=A0AC58TKA2_TOBAC